MAAERTRALRVRDAADLLAVSVREFYRLVKTPGFPAPVQVTSRGRTRRYLRHELERWLRNRPRG